MASRKKLVVSRNQLASLLTKLEAGKSSIKIGDAREMLALFVDLEAALHLKGYKSAMMILRKEAVKKAEAIKAISKKAKK